MSKARDAYQAAYEQTQAEHPDFSDAQINLFLSGKLGSSTEAPVIGTTRRWQLPTGDVAKNVDVINAGNGLVLAHNKLTGDTQVINPERAVKSPQQFKTVSEKIPATEEVPADVTTHRLHNLMPWGINIPPTTNSPAIPAQRERTETYNIPIPIAPEVAPADVAPTPAAPVFRIASPMGTSGFVGQNPRTESGFIGNPGGVNLFKTTAQLNRQAPAAVENVDAPKSNGVKVKDKATGKTFIYRGNPQDIPTDKYSIMQ